jgi:hypothetical protein
MAHRREVLFSLKLAIPLEGAVETFRLQQDKVLLGAPLAANCLFSVALHRWAPVALSLLGGDQALPVPVVLYRSLPLLRIAKEPVVPLTSRQVQSTVTTVLEKFQSEQEKRL